MRYLSACALVLALLAPAVSSAQQGGDAASLLALHRSYVGWQFGDGTFSTLRIAGRVRPAQGDAADASRSWTTLETGAVFRTTGFDPESGGWSDYGYTGRIFWESDRNGFTHPDYSARQAFEISQTALFAEGTTEVSSALQSPSQIDGTSYAVVRVQPPHGDTIDVYVDPSSGAYRRAVIDPGGAYQTTYDILGYTTVLPGKRMIQTYRINGSSNVDEFATIDANAPITPEELHPPAPTATWTFTNAQPFHVTMGATAILVDATINGVIGHFVVDSGASDILLTDDFANSAHLPITGAGAGTASSFGPQLRMHTRRVDTFTIGGNTLHNVQVETGGNNIIANATNYQEAQGTQIINGYIGFPLFAAAIVTLNLSDKTMSIADPSGTSVDRSTGYVAAPDLSQDIPVVPVLIDNRVTVNANLDMGNGGFVVLSQPLVDEHHIPILANEGTLSNAGMPNIGINSNMSPDSGNQMEDYMQSHVVAEGVGGTREVQRCSNVASIALGPIVYQSSYACVSPSLTGDFVIMGYSFLKNFDYVFDYPEGVMILKPHAQ
jgi:predicted aspartyl protease